MARNFNGERQVKCLTDISFKLCIPASPEHKSSSSQVRPHRWLMDITFNFTVGGQTWLVDSNLDGLPFFPTPSHLFESPPLISPLPAASFLTHGASQLPLASERRGTSQRRHPKTAPGAQAVAGRSGAVSEKRCTGTLI